MALSVTLAAAVSGCGGDGAVPAACEGTAIEGSTPAGQVTASSAVAVRRAEGAAYTIHLADVDLDPDDVTAFAGADAATGGTGATVWNVALTTLEPTAGTDPIEAGEVVEAGAPAGQLTVTVGATRGDEAWGSTIGADGTVAVSAADDGYLCGSIDYRDDEKSLRGYFQAPVVDA